ncbi:3-oxoacyl-[acyl-carrier-protein] reductase FabG-like [Plodia interpunctella]|uniref:3-oxoacyl-[acyl-carrier-protein] reductase FabG-like n=1 Tax=Plodia interpunctella TaxID=58824 RepID=UPI002367D8FB|nr:3-oxoacyl-[acyl-carrier-protein] reductase FabG-like [Plodia interpunctella]
MSFKNKVVIVTGASSGIGAATAIAFAKEGANVVLVGRNETKLAKTEAKCAENGKQEGTLVIKADVSKSNDAKRIIYETIGKFDKLDILVNNAGIVGITTVMDDNTMEEFDRIMNTNLRAVVHLTNLAASYLIKTKGNIVNISSVAGQVVLEGASAYMTSKAGLDHYSRGAAKEFAKFGVRVNVISPGPVITDILETLPVDLPAQAMRPTPLNRISDAEEIANLVLYLSSDKAIGITGSIFVTDNGMLLN